MRTASAGEASPTRADRRRGADESDLTGKARIRDSAIECFATEGFGASVRQIAQRAGVSAGLITHHFGSKEALRAECDAEVLHRYRELKETALLQPTERLLEALADADAHGPILLYILRSLQTGGPAGRDFVDHLVDDARDYLRQGVEAGLIKPSRDEEARLRYLTNQSLGALLIEFSLADEDDQKDLKGVLGRRIRTTYLPTLELFTEGLLANSDMLDAYLAYQAEHAPLDADDSDPPSAGKPPAGPPSAGPAA